MTKCAIHKCETDSEYDLYSREISFSPTNQLKFKMISLHISPITSEIIDQERFENLDKNMDDFRDYIQICPFVICHNCYHKNFGMIEMYGFGSHKIDEPQRGETSLFNLKMDIKDLKLEERNINNWEEILNLHVIVNADLSHDIVRGTNIEYAIFNTILEICKKISLYGIEGRRVGTAFIIGGDTEEILKDFTEQIVWNPFGYDIEHPGSSPERRNIANNDIKDGIIAFSQLDGVFIISNDGVVEAAGRRIKNIKDATDITLPGKGTRHHSVRMLTSKTSAIGIVVSQSGPITIFKNGENCGELRNINDYISPDP